MRRGSCDGRTESPARFHVSNLVHTKRDLVMSFLRHLTRASFFPRSLCVTAGPSAMTVRSTTCACCQEIRACTSTLWSTTRRGRRPSMSRSKERTPSLELKVHSAAARRRLPRCHGGVTPEKKEKCFRLCQSSVLASPAAHVSLLSSSLQAW